MRVDVHQHHFSEPLLDALSQRTRAPRLRSRDGVAWLELEDAPPWRVPAAGEGAADRAALVERDGLDRAVVALSSALGVEALPADEAEPLLAAYRDGVRTLPAAFAAWGSLPLGDAVPADVDRLLDDGFVGLCVPATAIATPAAIAAVGPLLERLEQRGAPLFVHPGPAATPAGAPDWWPALTGYVGALNDAWHAFLVAGRPEHPRLAVLFAALGGLAPLHAERLAARGGPVASDDPLLFVETSSYGPHAIRAVAAALGEERVLFGSDRPIAEPGPDGLEGRTRTHAGRLLARFRDAA